METQKTTSDLDDAEPGYVHSVAPDPRRQDPLDNPRAQEEGCIGMTYERKYYEFLDDNGPSVFIKRNLMPSEYKYNHNTGHLLFPGRCFERLQNEAAAIRFVQRNTTIPTPTIRCAFEDHGRYYLITDIVPGVTLKELPEEKKATVFEELQGYIAQMHAIKSKTMGSFLHGILPYRFRYEHEIKFRESNATEFVLCHNDLSQSNVIVDEKTLKITAIIDWEYAGFFPPQFDRPFYFRLGPSCALAGETDDVPELLNILEKWKV